MNELYNKLSTLSPERRALFERRLAEQGLADGLRETIAPRPAGLSEAPLSFAQQRLWFMQRLEPDNTAYNMKTVLRLRGALDRARLDRAFHALAMRHEPLRTRFVLSESEEVRQCVEPSGPAALDYVDLAGEARPEQAARNYVARLIGAPYDLSRPPLRAALLRLGENDHLLAFGLHHIAGDRWSLHLFVRDLSLLYQAGDASGLPDLPVQYLDWSLWQRKTLRGERLDQQLGYWTSQLADDLPVLELPFDRPRGATASTRGALHPVHFDPALSARLRAFARAKRVSLFTVLLAGFKVLLHLCSDSDDIVVGSEVANRDRPETQAIMGPLVNTLVLRTDLGGDPDFEGVLARVGAVVRGGLAHQDLPFERLVEALNPERRLNEMTPLFQAKFDLQHSVISSPALGDLTVEPFAMEDEEVKYELRFNLEDRDPEIGGRIEYSADLFDASTVALLAERYERLLATLLDNPDRALSRISLLTGGEVATALAEASTPMPDLPAELRLHDLVRAQAERTPDAAAITDGNASLTYAELMKRANAVATQLIAAGIEVEDRVGVCMRRTPDLVAALLGILKAGAAYVPLDPDYPQERLAFIAGDAGIDMLVCDGETLPFKSERPLQTLKFGDIVPATGPVDRGTADGLAYIIYTSGSTGRPKGVAIEHRNAVARMFWAAEQYSADELAGVLASTSVCFDLSVFEIFAPLSWGGKVVLVDNLLSLPRLDPAVGVTLVNTVPSLLRELLRKDELSTGVRTVNLAGEPLPPALLESLKSDPRGLKIYNLYGPSEDTTYSTGAALHGDAYGGGAVPIGRPLPGTTALVLDRAGRLRPKGLAGELWLAGAGLSRGYLNRPEQTADRFVSAAFGDQTLRLYRTGDRVRQRHDGRLDFLGRIDHQVKIRGFRIELGEIEHRLEKHPQVAEAVVIATGDAASPDRQLAAYFSPKAGEQVREQELRDALARDLPSHMVPTLWQRLDTLPHLPNGKVDRKALPGIGGTGRHELVAPRNETEARLAGIWADVLGVPEIGVHDGFFNLGGHSLLAIRIIARIEAEFAISLPLKTLFERPTVARLAEAVEERNNASAAARPQLVPDPSSRFEPFPLTDIQQAYWLGRNGGFELGNVGSHGYREFDVDGLDLEAFEAALRKLIARHDMLRAVVDADGSQRVLEDVPPYAVAVTDLRADAERDDRLAVIRERLSHQMFAPSRWPLFHIEAARLDDDTTRLFVGFDVLIGDAWSFKLMAREVAVLLAGEELPPLELTFRDYVLAERALEGSESHRRAVEHWRARLETLPPSPELPLAKAPSQIATPHFRRRSATLSAKDWAQFKERASEAGLTPTSAVLAAFSEVLARWSRKSHFTLNLTLFSREPVHPDVGSIVGDFTASLLLAADFSGRDAFVSRARRLQERLLDDLDHRSVSGVRVLRDLMQRQGRAASALMPVVFTSVLNQAQASDGGSPLGARLVNSVSQTPQVYLDHQVAEEQGALVFNWDAIEELFPQGMLDAMFSTYERFLRSLATDAESWRRMPDLVASEPFDMLNQAATQTLEGSGKLLHEAFFDCAQRWPERVAVIGGSVEVSYGELAGRALALAAALQERRAQPNRLVAISLEKGPDQAIACMGILAAGAAYVPIDPDLPRERRWQLIEDTAASVVISADSDWPANVERVAVPEEAGAQPRPVATRPTDLAYVIFTSGSTGRPKGVMIDHRGAMNTVLDINRRFAIGAEDRFFALSSLSFDLSVYDIFGPLAVGGAIVFPTPTEAKETASWPQLLRDHRVTIWNSVPALAQLLAAEMKGTAPTVPLRLIMMSGDWIPLGLPDTLRELIPAAGIVSLGGATEASIWSIFYPVEAIAPEWSSIPYGYPLANQRWYVLDEEGEPCPPWVPGRLFIGGMGVARGYWRQPALTAEKFVPDRFATAEEAAQGALMLYNTGDLGRLRGDGFLEFLGREDFQVKINGFRIELGEIEAHLLQHDGISEAVVSAMGSPSSLVAHVVPRLQGGNGPSRFEMKAERMALRTPSQDEERIALPDAPKPGALHVGRQSHRRFLDRRLGPDLLGGLLAALGTVAPTGAPLPKYAYPSAGSIYPIQTYVMVREDRFDSINGGWYYYHPDRHDLVRMPVDCPLGANAPLERLFGSSADLAGDSGFSILLAAHLPAMTHLYGDRARDFCLLEAGYMGQLLMMHAPEFAIGLCPVGGADFSEIARVLDLGSDHEIVHALCGGAIDPAWNQTWHAAANSSGAAPLSERLGTFLAERLPAYMIPRDVVIMDRLPLTANGKVDRKALPEPGRRRREAVEPDTADEARIVELWQRLLDNPAIGVTDNFFEAGGNSLTAMQLLTELRREFSAELTIAQLFGALTPRAQAKLVAAGQPAVESKAIPTLARTQDIAELADADVDEMLATLLDEEGEAR
ncbi:non-ribosomal peptide synthetase [Aquamicrobium sp. LC103]|uniref:non-ribosomal peptide synthetase n=1 Tax=Aquamicrobium sp. LC103 TaxID=1120658 RepID=UPI00063E932C|nr:non-ribosomal peptide synthetase [Aquamicrobium sp. LC103]TKT78137.1 non-ribosomal peptide synthetase [Aquamicrobium sp. LC103]